MHEVSIALAIVDEITERAAQAQAAKISAVYLRVGRLTAIDERALQFAWDLATSNTPAFNSKLVIDFVPLAIACKQCNAERVIDEGMLPICPVCGNSSNAIVRGRELLITAMEVDDGSSSGGSPTEHSA